MPKNKLKITEKTEPEYYYSLSEFYAERIREAAQKRGYRRLSEGLGHNYNFISVVLANGSIEPLRKLYLEILKFNKEIKK